VGYTRLKLDYEYYTLSWKGTFGGIPDSFQTATKLTYSNLRTGEKVPNWKEKIQKKLNATSVYSTSASRVERHKNGTVKMTYRYATGYPDDVLEFTGFQPVLISDVAHFATSTTAVENEALMKIIKKVRAQRSHLNGLAFTGELREAIHGLRHPFELMRTQVHSHLGKLSKAKLSIEKMPGTKRKQAWREVIAGTWLETSFGLRPLIHDTKEIAEALSRFQFETPSLARLQSKSTSLDHGWLRDYNGMSGRFLRYMREGDRITERTCTYSIGYEAVSRPAGSVRSLVEVLGFTPENFIPTLYELMPWSWLIDYFSNVGGMIEAGTTNESQVKWISKTVKIKTLDTWRFIPSAIETQAAMGSQTKLLKLEGDILGEVILSKIDLNRTKPSTLGIPKLTFTIPGKGTQAANLVAILAQFSGKPFDPSWEKRYRAVYQTHTIRNRGVRSISEVYN